MSELSSGVPDNTAAYYEELLHEPDGGFTPEGKEAALRAVRVAMGGIEEALRRRMITGIQISFTIPAAGEGAGFSFFAE